MEKFWSKVDRLGLDDCWSWLGAKDKNGYGIFARSRPRKGKTARSSRIVWELTRGPIPEGLYVLHTCDNPGYCNPAHLWLGTAKENTQDAIRKGRFVNPPRHIGEANPGGGKLTEQKIRKIRTLRATGKYTLTELGDMFNVTFSMIWQIVTRKSWSHVE